MNTNAMHSPFCLDSILVSVNNKTKKNNACGTDRIISF